VSGGDGNAEGVDRDIRPGQAGEGEEQEGEPEDRPPAALAAVAAASQRSSMSGHGRVGMVADSAAVTETDLDAYCRATR